MLDTNCSLGKKKWGPMAALDGAGLGRKIKYMDSGKNGRLG
jgi:hypothetical protein